MTESMVMVDSRRFHLIDGPGTGNVSLSEYQGVCGEAGDELE